jgi:hypothetical protein
MFEWLDYYLVRCLENAAAIWQNNTTCTFLGNLFLEDEQQTGL